MPAQLGVSRLARDGPRVQSDQSSACVDPRRAEMRTVLCPMVDGQASQLVGCSRRSASRLGRLAPLDAGCPVSCAAALLLSVCSCISLSASSLPLHIAFSTNNGRQTGASCPPLCPPHPDTVGLIAFSVSGRVQGRLPLAWARPRHRADEPSRRLLPQLHGPTSPRAGRNGIRQECTGRLRRLHPDVSLSATDASMHRCKERPKAAKRR